jgi:hypothetical protein
MPTCHSGGADLTSHETVWIVLGVAFALVVGKPEGVFLTSSTLVRLGLCRLPKVMSWRGVGLVALLAGIGFTMSGRARWMQPNSTCCSARSLPDVQGSVGDCVDTGKSPPCEALRDPLLPLAIARWQWQLTE